MLQLFLLLVAIVFIGSCIFIDVRHPLGIPERHLRIHWQELKDRGYDVAALMLQGSQNYGLAQYDEEYTSDVDSKAIVVPSFRDFLEGKPPVSETIKLKNGEQIDVKDIRVMCEMWRKQNLSYLELLFTDYKIVNWKYRKALAPLWENASSIAAIDRKQLARSIAGTVMEKRKALCHPYPGLVDKIEKYGYDGKQLSHAVRLVEIMEKLFIFNKPLGECFMTDERELLMAYKKQSVSCEEAIRLCDLAVRDTGNIKDNVLEKKDDYGIRVMEKVRYDVLKKKIKREI